jgi:hypothetical protein
MHFFEDMAALFMYGTLKNWTWQKTISNGACPDVFPGTSRRTSNLRTGLETDSSSGPDNHIVATGIYPEATRPHRKAYKRNHLM